MADTVSPDVQAVPRYLEFTLRGFPHPRAAGQGEGSFLIIAPYSEPSQVRTLSPDDSIVYLEGVSTSYLRSGGTATAFLAVRGGYILGEGIPSLRPVTGSHALDGRFFDHHVYRGLAAQQLLRRVSPEDAERLLRELGQIS